MFLRVLFFYVVAVVVAFGAGFKAGEASKKAEIVEANAEASAEIAKETINAIVVGAEEAMANLDFRADDREVFQNEVVRIQREVVRVPVSEPAVLSVSIERLRQLSASHNRYAFGGEAGRLSAMSGESGSGPGNDDAAPGPEA